MQLAIWGPVRHETPITPSTTRRGTLNHALYVGKIKLLPEFICLSLSLIDVNDVRRNSKFIRSLLGLEVESTIRDGDTIYRRLVTSFNEGPLATICYVPIRLSSALGLNLIFPQDLATQ